jgi:YVTN family beta-propeller protein
VTASFNVYAHDMAGDWSPNLSPAVIAHPLVYVPDSDSDTVDVIDPATFKIVHHYVTGANPQHVAPSYDLRRLFVDNDEANSLTPIDPTTGLPSGPNIPVADPYNMYFTPDGSMAIVVCEALRRLDFRNPQTFALIKSLPVPLPIDGIDHLDFSADGSYAVMSAEYSGDLVKVDIKHMSILGSLHVGGSPVDVKLSPDGSRFYVANQKRDGVSVIDGDNMTEVGFIPTGYGAHGLYPSRDATELYVSNRGDPARNLPGQGVSVISFATNSVVAHWEFSGSPDMGGVSPDGSQLWLSGRYNKEVYVISTKTGQLLARIPVGAGPHGLDYFPQPGRFSIGHTGNYR